MQRYFLVALFVLVLACVMQATSAPAEETTPANALEEALKSAGDSISKAFSDAKPKLDELLAQSQQFFDTVGKKISEEAAKIIPKTDEKPAS